jgi:hypothetical protein
MTLHPLPEYQYLINPTSMVTLPFTPETTVNFGVSNQGISNGQPRTLTMEGRMVQTQDLTQRSHQQSITTNQNEGIMLHQFLREC